MTNKKISRKLTSAFAVIILLCVVIGGLGVYGLNRVNQAGEEMYNKNMVSLLHIGNIRANYQSQRALTRTLMICGNNSQEYQDTLALMQQAENEMENHISLYRPTIVSGDVEDSESFEKFVEIYGTDFANLKNEVYQMGDTIDQDDVNSFLDSGRTISSQVEEKLDYCLERNTSHATALMEDNQAAYRNFIILEASMLLIAIILAATIVFRLNHSIVGPIKAMVGAANNIADGKVDVEIPDAGNDEVGLLAESFRVMAENVKEQTVTLGYIAQGDLTKEIAVRSEYDMIGNAIADCAASLNRTMLDISAAAGQVSIGADQVSESSQQLAQGASEQATAIEQLSSSIYEISLNTKESAQTAEMAAELFDAITQRAQESSDLMGEMMQAVEEINVASADISKIMKLMSDISFQTNILSLNAAVEAANAGEHGRGFAVVANEVRNLAAKSAQAAADTDTLIASSMEKARLGASIAQKTNDALHTIVDDIVHSVQHVNDIAKATSEQSISIEQVNIGIDQVSQVINMNSATAEQSAMAAEEMSSMADGMAKLASNFKLKHGEGISTLGTEDKPEAVKKPKREKPVIILEDENGKY